MPLKSIAQIMSFSSLFLFFPFLLFPSALFLSLSFSLLPSLRSFFIFHFFPFLSLFSYSLFFLTLSLPLYLFSFLFHFPFLSTYACCLPKILEWLFVDFVFKNKKLLLRLYISLSLNTDPHPLTKAMIYINFFFFGIAHIIN